MVPESSHHTGEDSGKFLFNLRTAKGARGPKGRLESGQTEATGCFLKPVTSWRYRGALEGHRPMSRAGLDLMEICGLPSIQIGVVGTQKNLSCTHTKRVSMPLVYPVAPIMADLRTLENL